MKSYYTYSPLPIREYFLPDPYCHITKISRESFGRSLWNLEWMSVPTLDLIPGSNRSSIPHGYQSDVTLIRCLAEDVINDEVLYRKLLMHPSRFLDWWEREDHSIYDTYDIYGDAWVETVAQRANQAALRLMGNPSITAKLGNVVHVAFGDRRVA